MNERANPRAVILGLVLSVVMSAANLYVGLKAGMTVSASKPAAVMAMLLFRFFFRKSSILEANQVQTCASAGESLAAGILFTMPALILIGHWQSFDYWVSCRTRWKRPAWLANVCFISVAICRRCWSRWGSSSA
jgi:putative OPT family oligopeptide transporter